jgi:hypothetical protein
MSFVIAVPRDSRLQGKLDLIAQVKECVRFVRQPRLLMNVPVA